MDFWTTLTYLLWVYPAAIMTAWSVVTLVVAWMAPLGRPVPLIMTLHPMVVLINPKAWTLKQRPKLWLMLSILVVGVIPVLCAAALVLLVWLSVLMQRYRLKRYFRRQAEKHKSA
jgi:hypothetical protein